MPKAAKLAKNPDAPELTLEDWGLLIGLAALWGGVFFLSEIVLVAFPPLSQVAIRVSIAAAALWLALLARGMAPPRELGVWGALLLLGLVNSAAPFSLIVYGQTHIEAGLASILNATTPVFAVIVAGLLLSDEKITASRMAGVLIGLAGAALVIGPSALLDIRGSSTIGQLSVLGAALCYGFGAVGVRRLAATRLPLLSIAAGQLTAAALIVAPAALLIDRPFGAEAMARYAATPSGELLWIWAALIVQGVACTALAILMYFRIIASAGAGNGALVTFLIPPFAILLGALFLSERLELEDYLGMLVIGFGLALLDGRLLRR